MDIPTRLEDLPNSKPRFVGEDVAQIEARDHVMGRTEYVDNVSLRDMLHCAILRSPHGHARIKKIDASAALKLPGVHAVVTGEDAQRWTNPLFAMPTGWGSYCIATDKARYVGEPVAAVAAVSRYVAEDALELIEVEYETLPAVADGLLALDPGSPVLFEEHGSNIMFHKDYTWGDVDQAFASADQVFTEKFRWHPMGANAMETFGIIARWDMVDGTITCQGGIQTPGFIAGAKAAAFNLPQHKVRMTGQPRGGTFGGKSGVRSTDIAILLSRKAGGVPVKFIEDRMEGLLAGGNHAWDRFYEASLAVKKDGTMTGLKVKLVDDMGATGEGMGAFQSVKPLACFTGCYAIPAASYDLTLVASNKTPQTAYRGAGPPPHYFVLEQMVDIAARGIKMDPAELRRKNYIQPDQFPYTIPSGNEYDSGNYELALDSVLEMANYRQLRQEQAEARAQGRYLGIGLVSIVEPGVFDFNTYASVGMPVIGIPEGVTVSMDMLGNVTVCVGFTPEGQGQWTTGTMVAADFFGIGMENVRIVYQDTLSAPPHFGPGGSRLGVALTGAIIGACTLLKEKLIKVAAVLLQTGRENVELMDGMLQIKGVPGAAIPMGQIVATMLNRSDLLPPDVDMNPSATYVWTAAGRNEPDDMGRCRSYLTAANACHLAVVELDPETGKMKILKYYIADDCGTRLNPVAVEGMTDGGVAQGVGAVMFEEYLYDDDAQPLVTTFMDYMLPTIHEVPSNQKKVLVTPSPVAPLGAKGCGEGSLHTTPATLMCAINDALAPLGVGATEVPASPRRLWRLIQEARQAR